MMLNLIFFNRYFDKNRLKALVLWSLTLSGEKTTIDLVEKLKTIGFHYATQAGLSLSIDDLKIPPTKPELILEAEILIQSSQKEYEIGNLTSIEKFQQLIDVWHRTSEVLKENVIQNFRSTDTLNPVYMMAFSGARGNISQVRQLVGMRGLMADPQGQILDFPIRSNFREGLTLTEYVISCYGARKGLVDTALRTASSGYLTRRLVDVAQHVIVRYFDCGTNNGIVISEMKDGKKILFSLQKRLIGRVLGEKIEFIARKNQDISPALATKISQVKTQVLVRSPLTCDIQYSLCQLCYGWSLAHGKLVSLGEAVGVLAAQSIGEPGTQLTMRTFHTGGVFSGDVMQEIRSPFSGIAQFTSPLQGRLIRTLHGKIAFLTKTEGTLTVLNKSKITFLKKSYQIPSFTVLFIRQFEEVKENQLLAEFSSFVTSTNQGIQTKYNLKSENEGQIYFEDVCLGLKYDKKGELISKTSLNFGSISILEGKLYESPIPFVKVGDLIDTQSILSQSVAGTLYSGILEYSSQRKKKNRLIRKNINSQIHFYSKKKLLKTKILKLKQLSRLKQSFGELKLKTIHYKKVGYFLSLTNVKNLKFFFFNSLTNQFTTLNNIHFRCFFKENTKEKGFFIKKIKQFNCSTPQNYLIQKSEYIIQGNLNFKNNENFYFWATFPYFPNIFDGKRKSFDRPKVGQLKGQIQNSKINLKKPNYLVKSFRIFKNNYLIQTKNLQGNAVRLETKKNKILSLNIPELQKKISPQIPKNFQVGYKKTFVFKLNPTVFLHKLFTFDFFSESSSNIEDVTKRKSTDYTLKQNSNNFIFHPLKEDNKKCKIPKYFLQKKIKIRNDFCFNNAEDKKELKTYIKDDRFHYSAYPDMKDDRRLTLSKSLLVDELKLDHPLVDHSHNKVMCWENKVSKMLPSKIVEDCIKRWENYNKLISKHEKYKKTNFNQLKIQLQFAWISLPKNLSQCLFLQNLFDKLRLNPDGFLNFDQYYSYTKIIKIKKKFYIFSQTNLSKNIRYIYNKTSRGNQFQKTSLILKSSNEIKISRNIIYFNNFYFKNQFLVLTKQIKAFNLLNKLNKKYLFNKLTTNLVNLKFYNTKEFFYNKQKETTLTLEFPRVDLNFTSSSDPFSLNFHSSSKEKGNVKLLFPFSLELSLIKKISFDPIKLVDREEWTNDKIFISNKKRIFAQTDLSLKSFFSPFHGEITRSQSKKDSLNRVTPINSTEVKPTQLILTINDQIKFLYKKNQSLIKIGQLVRYGDQIFYKTAVHDSGQIIQIDKKTITLRKAKPILFSSNGVFHVDNRDLVEKNTPLITLFYKKLKTEDIVQGIPKIEELFEARQTKEGQTLQKNLHTKLQSFFQFYKQHYSSQKAARKSIEKIQQILVNNVQQVYQSQGVSIADKHIEIIARQMTTKVKIIKSGETNLLKGELYNLDSVELVNLGKDLDNEILKRRKNKGKAEYEPIILGITKAALETKSFISASSFQETTRILSRAVIARKTDFLRGLKENVILGQLVPAGTGFSKPLGSAHYSPLINSKFRHSEPVKKLSWTTYTDIIKFLQNKFHICLFQNDE